MKGAFTYDEMLYAPILMQPIAADPQFQPRPLSDIDVGLVQDRLQHLGLKTARAKMSCIRPSKLRAHERRFHPVRDYLTALAVGRHASGCDRLLQVLFRRRRTPSTRASSG